MDVGVIFRCILVRKGQYVLEDDRRPKKGEGNKHNSRVADNTATVQSGQAQMNTPPNTNVSTSTPQKKFQQPTMTTFYTSVPRLADAEEIMNKISDMTNIPEERLKICTYEAQPSGVDGLDDFIQCKPWDMSNMEGPVMQFKKSSNNNSSNSGGVTDLMVFESTLHTDDQSKDYEHHQDAVEVNQLARRLSQALWPSRPAHFRVGLRVDAMDHQNVWFPGSVIDVNDKKGSVKVHFDLFSHKWDEEYGMADIEKKRVAPVRIFLIPFFRIGSILLIYQILTQ